jgi:hypothetical protein
MPVIQAITDSTHLTTAPFQHIGGSIQLTMVLFQSTMGSGKFTMAATQSTMVPFQTYNYLHSPKYIQAPVLPLFDRDMIPVRFVSEANFFL